MSLDPHVKQGFDALIERQLAVARLADPHHCSGCGRYLWEWYLGFPMPVCPACQDRQRAGRARQGYPARGRLWLAACGGVVISPVTS